MSHDTLNLKIQSPTWDSNKREEWHTFSANFKSYVTILGGANLITYLDGGSQMEPSLIHHSPNDNRSQASDHPSTPRSSPPEEAATLTQEDMALDAKLYHIMVLSIKGQAHDIILHSDIKTFTSAYVMLENEFAAANAQRKTQLISNLFDLLFDGDLPKFKQKVYAETS